MKRTRAANRVVAALLIASTGVNYATAAEDDDWTIWPLGRPIVIGGSAFFANLDTKTQVNSSSGIIGTRVDFEQNLGMADSKTLPEFHLDWRFARRHLLALSYFELARTGTEVTETEIRIGDTVFSADLPVSSFFDVDTLSLTYQYSLIFDARKDIAIGIGIAQEDIRFGLQGNNGSGLLQEVASTSSPVPTLNIRGAYAFTDKWMIEAGIGFLALELDLEKGDDLEGQVFEAQLSVFHQTFNNLRFGIAYNVFDLDVSWTQKGKFTAVQYNYHGPQLIVSTTF